METYRDKDKTPMSFHRLFRFVILPLTFIGLLYQTISVISKLNSFEWISATMMGLDIVKIILSVVCFVGFFSFKPYAWYSVMAFLWVNIGYYVFAIIVYVLVLSTGYIAADIVFICMKFAPYLIFSICASAYYIKRKPLFFE